MPDHVYRIIQVAGSSQKHRGCDPERRRSRLEHAAPGRLVRGGGDARPCRRRQGAHYQVTLKIGFTLDDDD